MSYNFSMDGNQPTFTTTTTTSTNTTETLTDGRNGNGNDKGSVFSPLAAPFQSRRSELINVVNPQETRAADAGPSSIDFDQMMMNMRVGGSEMYNRQEQSSNSNYFFGESTQSVVGNAESISSNIWGDDNSNSASTARAKEMMDTFEFLIKSLSSANNYVSNLTREQLSVLRSIRPALLYEFLQEVVKVRCGKRMRRALPNECAFCKNNGENEECFTSHSLKDWGGRVECPVLRAFHCPRCGATGDRAHTIKYCPENSEGLERTGTGSFASRRRGGSSFHMNQPPTAPASSPSPSTPLSHSFMWNNTFGMN